MKKALSILIVCIMMLALASHVAAAKRGGLAGYVPCLGAEESITVDGQMEAFYDDALAINIYVPDGRNSLATSTVGTAYLLWSEGKFYTFVKVLDADVVAADPELQKTTPWITDSFEIFFDLGNDQSQPIVHARVDHTGYGSFYLEDESVNVKGDGAKEYFDYASFWTSTGYCVELCVDLSKYADIYEGMEIGLNLMINDMTSGNLNDRTAIYYMPSKLTVRDWWKDSYDYIVLGNEYVNDPVSSIELDRQELPMNIAEIKKLTATVHTENGSHHNVKWTSSDPSVATVSADGTVTAKTAGTTSVKATTLDGTKTAICIVSVGKALRYDTTYGTAAIDGVISAGEWDGVTAAEMANMTNPGYSLPTHPTMKIKNDDMYMYVLVEAETPDGDNDIFVCVHVDHEDCELDTCESYIKIVIDGGNVLAGKENPVWTYNMDENRDGKNDFSADTNGGKSDLTRVAYGFNQGKFIAEIRLEANYGARIPEGAASVDVRLDSSKYATHQWAYQERTWDRTFSPRYDGGTLYFDLPEVSVPVTGVTMDQGKRTLGLDEIATLTASVQPENATVKALKWRSSDASVAEVSENGIVTAKKPGKATITATTAEGGFVAACEITVTNVLSLENHTMVGEFAYQDRLDLTEVVIPDGVTMIGYRAFYDCTNLISVTIPESVVAIGSEAFFGCHGLTIYGYADSYAQSYAAENDITFVEIADTGDDTEEPVISADLNGDGVVDKADKTYLGRHLLAPSRYQLPEGVSADYNGDGVVDKADKTYLGRHLLAPGRYPIPKTGS